MRDEDEAGERADRLIAEGVRGDRGLIASIILEAVQHEREACAKIADARAAVCRDAYDKGDRAEVHPMNEALHIAQLIRNQRKE